MITQNDPLADLISFPAPTKKPINLRSVIAGQAAIYKSSGDLTMDLWTTSRPNSTYSNPDWKGQIKFEKSVGQNKGLHAFNNGGVIELFDTYGNHLILPPMQGLLFGGGPVKSNMTGMSRFTLPSPTSWASGKAVFQ